MRFRFITITLSFLSYFQLIAQQRFGNEWINYSQVYFKIPIVQNGIYRIDFETLKKGNFPVEKAPVSEIQLFHHGKEIAFHTNADSKNPLKNNEFIEFYAEKNDGQADSSLYRPASNQPHQFYSLYTDTTYYYLTFSPNIQQVKRIKTSQKDYSNLKPEPYHQEILRKVFTDEFSFNSTTGPIPPLQQSYFENAEGWTGKMLRKDVKNEFKIDLQNWVKTNDSLAFTYQVNGRSNDFRELISTFNNAKTDTTYLGGFQHQTIFKKLANDAIQNNTLTLTLQAAQERYSLNYWQLSYPQKFVFEGGNKYFYLRKNPQNQSFIQIESPQNARLYDITDKQNPVLILTQNTDKFVNASIENAAQNCTLFIASKINQIADIQAVTFEKNNNVALDFLIITHPKLMGAAKEYAAYRSSKNGGNFRVQIANIHQIYEQFGYGEPHPLAVKRFADYMLSGSSIKYLLLLGKAHSVFTFRTDKEELNLVPTIGYPASDALLTAGLNGKSVDLAAIPTGRIPAKTNAEVLIYLEKLKATESRTSSLNNKRVLHLNGGKTFEEIRSFGDFLASFESNIENDFLGGKTLGFRKKTLDFVEPANVQSLINEGVSFISFLGHSSTEDTDFDIGFVSPPQNGYRNKGKYPVLFYNGCSFNNYFRETRTMSADWLFTPDKGAVAVIGQSYFGYTISLNPHIAEFYKNAFSSKEHFDKPIGDLLQITADSISRKFIDIYNIANIHQTLLFGDPALRIFNTQKPDYQLLSRDLSVETLKGGSSIATADSLFLNIKIGNLGKYEVNKKIGLEIRKVIKNGQNSIEKFSLNNISFQDTLRLKIINQKDLAGISAKIDTENIFDETNEQNNEASLAFDAELINQVNYYPVEAFPDRINPIMNVLIDEKIQKNGDFVAQNPLFSVILQDENPLITPVDTAKIEVLLKQVCPNCQFKNIVLNKSLKSTQNKRIQIDFQLKNLSEGTYEVQIQGQDLAGNQAGKLPFQTSFKIGKNTESTDFVAFPNPTINCINFDLKNVDSFTDGELKLSIYNEKGIEVQYESRKISAGTSEFNWCKQPHLATGRYIYKAIFEQNNQKKVVFDGIFIVW